MLEYARDLRLEVDLPGELLDVDGRMGGDWAAIADGPAGQVLLFNSVAVSVPRAVAFPRIRQIDRSRVVLVDSRADSPGEINAWVLDVEGRLHAAFSVGDGVQDVLASADGIVVTYFDEGVFGSPGPNTEGLCVFTLSGELSLGFHSVFGAPDIADCYCACWVSKNECAFVPYTEFPFVRLNVTERRAETVVMPEELAGSTAVSVRQGQAMLWSPYGDRNALISWDIGAPSVKRVGSYAGPLRGLQGGRFFSAGTFGYTIIGPFEDHNGGE